MKPSEPEVLGGINLRAAGDCKVESVRRLTVSKRKPAEMFSNKKKLALFVKPVETNKPRFSSAADWGGSVAT